MVTFYNRLFWISGWFRTILCTKHGLNTIQICTRQRNNWKIFWFTLTYWIIVQVGTFFFHSLVEIWGLSGTVMFRMKIFSKNDKICCTIIRQFRVIANILSWFVSWSDKKQPVNRGIVYYEAHIKYYFY